MRDVVLQVQVSYPAITILRADSEYANPCIPMQTPEKNQSDCMQSPGQQLALCVVWCLIWWFASLENVWSYTTPNVLTETLCHWKTKPNQTRPAIMRTWNVTNKQNMELYIFVFDFYDELLMCMVLAFLQLYFHHWSKLIRDELNFGLHMFWMSVWKDKPTFETLCHFMWSWICQLILTH